MKSQSELNQAIVAIGINVVTCGHCGHVLLADLTADTVKCPHCATVQDHADAPDLFLDEPDWYYSDLYIGLTNE